jgi:hypothetical protein
MCAHILAHTCRAHVIASLPGLRVLDAHEVEHYEGAAAMEVLEQEDSYLAMMLHNACMAHKMVCGCGFMCECECGFGCIGMSVGVGVWVHVRMDRLITHTNCSQTHTLQQLHLHRELFNSMYGRRARAVVKGRFTHTHPHTGAHTHTQTYTQTAHRPTRSSSCTCTGSYSV